MDQAIKMMLLAKATGEVTKRLQSFLDFDTVKARGHEFMRMAADISGSSPSEARQHYENGFAELKQHMLASAEVRAQEEMLEAVKEVEAEQRAHIVLVDNIRQLHQKTMRILFDRHERAIPKDASDDFVVLTNSSHVDLTQSAIRFHGDLMAVVQAKHRLKLEFCFMNHLVSEETAKSLANLYELK